MTAAGGDRGPSAARGEVGGATRSGSSKSALGSVVLLLVAAGAALLWSSSLVWDARQVARAAPLPPVVYSIAGSTAVPMTVALGLVALAAVVAVLAAGTLGRRIVGGAVAAVSIWTLVQLVGWSGASPAQRIAVLQDDGIKHGIGSAPQTGALAVPIGYAGVLLALAAAAVLLVRAGALPRMGSKYERGTARTARPGSTDPAAQDRDMWSRLDRGEDPTD
ncbi:Trp biosynthesis-associated membrane protein [Cumulibacter manganitolerans]|uniref:Trp biosynthesis-associated membrane protein n=1 Tax=Cumulibacter manganitolerans TaxID=1884992 RepID=UPI001294B2C6|nr:Trp biosynthesis-associated membrane protein [Cumulibacter manganitolerans]